MRNNQRRTGASAQSPAPVPTSADMAYAVPTEFVELPSRGAFYPDGHPLQDQETVEIRYMTAKEEDILASTALMNKGLTIDRLLSSLILLDVEPASLLIGDRNAIMIAARISAYGPHYNAEVSCPSCFTRDTYIFDLNKTNLTEDCFSKSFLRENKATLNKEAKTFDVVLPKSNVTASIRLFNGKDEKSMNDDIGEETAVTSVLTKFIVSIDGNSDASFVENFISNSMLAADSKYIRDLYPKLAPNIDLKQQYTCANCTHQEEMEVPLSAEFFWPR
jgi:hypothetical protein